MKPKVRISKKFTFEAAHALDGYSGLCKNIHGHSYHFSITLMGEVIDNPLQSSHGMVMDFKALKAIVNQEVIHQFDHALILHKGSKYVDLGTKNEKTILVNYQPTCENMIIDFVERIQTKLPQGITLIKAYLQETSTSYCEWFLEDNE